MFLLCCMWTKESSNGRSIKLIFHNFFQIQSVTFIVWTAAHVMHLLFKSILWMVNLLLLTGEFSSLFHVRTKWCCCGNNSSYQILSVTASFRRDIKWEQKDLYVGITDLFFLKIFLHQINSQPIRLGLQNMPSRKSSSKKCPGYDTKFSDGETLVLDLWRRGSTRSLLLFPYVLWLGVVLFLRVQSIGHIKLLKYLSVNKQMTYVKLNY